MRRCWLDGESQAVGGDDPGGRLRAARHKTRAFYAPLRLGKTGKVAATGERQRAAVATTGLMPPWPLPP